MTYVDACAVGIVVLLAACAGSRSVESGAGTPEARAAAGGPYHVYVANESSDIVSKVAFTPGQGASVVGETRVGMMPADIDGPHGLAVSPDGRSWFVSLAHGTPFGKVWRYAVPGDTLAGRAELGLFPASMGVTPDGQFLFVVNFNLHGDPVPSSVSVVYTPTMTEIARPTTCVMPHGSRVNMSGTKHYSACMHSEQLVELDTRTFKVSARFALSPGKEGRLDVSDTGEHRAHTATAAGTVCSPTWAQPAKGKRADRFVYVPCNKANEVLEVDVQEWKVTRRFATGKAPYNLETAADGRHLIVTLKGGQGVAIIDLDAGQEVARIATSQPITHGVVASPDSRYAFVTNEAVGSTRGTLDVIDLGARQLVATAQLQYQPGGVDFWPAAR